MGSSSGGKKKYITFRNRQRANMSFFIVVMFFAVFGIIVFTEIFFIDEHGRATGVLVRHGSLGYSHKQDGVMDYEDTGQDKLSLQEKNRFVKDDQPKTSSPRWKKKKEAEILENNEDYISIRVGAAVMNDEMLGSFLLGGKQPVALPVLENAALASSKMVTENQLPPYPDNSTPTEGSWQTVNGTRYKFFVFSAFYEYRKQRSIRIIGATRTRGPERVWCRLWYKDNDFNSSYISITIPAVIKIIRENWNLKYSACFVVCPLANKTVPSAVSVVLRVKDTPSNLLAVINNYNYSLPINKFGVCVKPLHFDYNRDIQILEFIELNRLLGVEHFTFYNHTIGHQVSCILRDYVENGLVTILSWQLSMLSQKEIRTEGLFAALNDCLYRSMNKYSHILLIDLDEYIIPKNNDTLPELISFLNHRLNTKTMGAFSFQNAFFYLQWDDDDSVYDLDDSVSANLITLRKTRRRSKLHPHKQRSKYICRPELTIEAGNHFVWEFVPGHGTLNVPAESAILHHYRICEFGGNDCIKTASIVDTTTYRYKDTLTNAVKVQYSRLKSKCSLADLRTPKSKVLNKLISLLNPSQR